MEFLTALYYSIMTLALMFSLGTFLLGGVPILNEWRKRKRLPSGVDIKDTLLYVATPVATFFASVVAIVVPVVANL